ncbi:MAG TPA: amino acid permease, partial [Blastocatellia bacterium]|nr:amino acid permease [Blastocatellia bacterium]
LEVQDGDEITAGEALVEGPRDPKELIEIKGVRETQSYLVGEVQSVYRDQGVSIDDKHIELIVRQMTRRVAVSEPGESEFLPGERVDQKVFADTNRRLVEEGKKPAEGRPELMGITKASLATDSWLSAASFQETTRVLTDAAINCRSDKLNGLKENVIIGKLIPAGTGISRYRNIQVQPTEEARAAAYTIPSYEDQYYSPDFGQATGAAVPKNPQVASANWHPFIPENTGKFGDFGWSGIARGAASIFFAFIGFDAVSTAAQEARNPQRDMPIGILGSLAICTLLYIAVSGLLTGVLHYSQLNVAAPVALAIDATGVKWGSLLVKAGTIAGTATVMLMTLMGQSRIFFVMSKDGMLPAWAGAIHPRFRTPWISSIVVGLLIAVFAGLLPISILGDLVNIGTLFAFVIVCIGVWILRKKRPELPRPFKTPLVPVVPVMGIVLSLLLMAMLPWDTWMRLIVWLVIGLGIYFAYGRKRIRAGAERLEKVKV